MARSKGRIVTKRPAKKTAKKKAPAKRKVKANGLEPTHRLRIRVLAFALLLLFGIVSSRLVKLHIEPDYRLIAERPIGEKEVTQPRGYVYDLHGRLLATNIPTKVLTADPSRVTDPEAAFDYLRGHIAFDEEAVRRRLADKTKKYVVIKRRLTVDDVAALHGHEKDSLGKWFRITTELQRFYPNGLLASHVLGFMTDGRGKEGIEQSLDDSLRGIPGWKRGRLYSDRKFLEMLTLESEPPTGGDDVYLTIDSRLQFQLEVALDKAMEEREASGAMGILMDPHTGAILAMGCRPAFDPNRYGLYSDHDRRNKAVIDMFEPGSAVKIVTAAAALELGIVTPETMIDCEGGSMYDPAKRGMLTDTHKRGVIPFVQCFAESSNIAMVKVAKELGEEQVEHWMRRFGFGQQTGIKLPQETQGILRPVSEWWRGSISNVPIGQEMSVNLVQLARAFSVIANGGFLVQPYLVEKTVSPEGDTTNLAPSMHERVITDETSRTMRRLMHAVVTGEEATGRELAKTMADYRVGVKTGTGQIWDPVAGKYSGTEYTAVIGGFAPIADPRLTCVIVVSKPKYGEHHGGQAAGPVFKEAMSYALNELNVPKDPMLHDDRLENYMMLTALGSETEDAPILLDIEDDPSEFDVASAESELRGLPGDRLTEGPTLPDLMHLSRRMARRKLRSLGIEWTSRGAGRVVEQTPLPGALIQADTVCQLVFDHETSRTRNKN